MGGRSGLYIVCVALFPLGFAAFVVGFGCPVWKTSSERNEGLWQNCYTVFKNCTTLEFADTEWMAGIRGVEIFAIVMLTIALTEIIYENACTNFKGRSLAERLATGSFCILSGMGGLAGIITYVIERDGEITGGFTYGWALALLAAGSGLLLVIGVGFLIHGAFLEKRKKKDKDPSRMNGSPYVTSNDENYELSAYTNRAYDHDMGRGQPKDNLPGFAVYNGPLTRAGDRNSLAGPGSSVFGDTAYPPTANVLPPYTGRPGSAGNPRYSPSPAPKMPQYYSVSDGRPMDPTFDLSEGYRPVRRSARPGENLYGGPRPADNPYMGRVAEDPYSERPSNIPVRRIDDLPAHYAREDSYNRLNRFESAASPRPFVMDSYYQGAPF